LALRFCRLSKQGGQSRSRVILLNLIYSAGMMAVFLVLATLAVTLHSGWGQHFGSAAFNISLSALVFAMALSFLGVWEIPIPGFVGSGAAAEAASREGVWGAFAKGVVTTVIATPCSGPYLGTIFGFTIDKPAYITYLIFVAVGLGMASPYLLIGAFPRLVKLLPKPGAWMDTFKQMMGFVLLGTVVFLFTSLKPEYFIPTFALLIGIWAGCWWIGRMPFTLARGRRLLGWLEGAAFAAVVGSAAFTFLIPGEHLLQWQPFTRPMLSEFTGQGKTVLVEFTANWCPTCKWNMAHAIDTDEVRRLVEENGVVPLLADWSDGSEEVHDMLRSLQSESIPLLAIFPAGKPNQPIVLRDLVSQRQVLEALKNAGPSRNPGMARTPGPARASAAPTEPARSRS